MSVLDVLSGAYQRNSLVIIAQFIDDAKSFVIIVLCLHPTVTLTIACKLLIQKEIRMGG